MVRRPTRAAQLYLKIDGKKVTYAGAADDLKKAQWVLWTVDLALLGVDVKKVTSLVIGIDGAGVSGVLYIDDIQLQP